MNFGKKAVGLASAVVAVVILVLLALFILKGMPVSSSSPSFSPLGFSPLTNEKGLATIDLYVMSQCPYGTMAETEVSKVLEKFGSDLNFKLHFVVSESNGVFSSLHGKNEVDEDARQACIIKNNPDQFFNYLKCVNLDYQDVAAKWESCASALKLDTAKIKSCAAGSEGQALLSADAVLTVQNKVSSSPTFFINGKKFAGDWKERTLTHELCKIIPQTSACLNRPPEPRVNLIIVNDETCESCSTASMENQLNGLFFNLTVNRVDYSTEKGKRMFNEFGAAGLPLFVFDQTLDSHPLKAQLERYLTKVGTNYQLRLKPVKLVAREEIPNSVSLFVMSQCPYGTIAQDLVSVVSKALPNVTVETHFITSYDANTSTVYSLHGEQEVLEDARELCVAKKWSDKLDAYVECFIKNYTSSTQWVSCAASADVPQVTLTACAEGSEGLQLLKADAALSKELGITGSPTFLLNNQYFYSGERTPEALQQAICRLNKGIEGCSIDLSNATTSLPSVPIGSCVS